MQVANFIPKDFHTLTPYLIIKGAAAAIDFYRKAFLAEETMRLAMPDGNIVYAALKIGNSMLMLADEQLPMKIFSPEQLHGTPVIMHLYVDNVDAWIERALNTGATLVRPVEDQFFGDRMGGIQDPFGHIWYLATHKEDVAPHEIHQRFQKLISA